MGWAGQALSMHDVKYKIVDGPMIGLYTGVTQYNEYYTIWNDIKSLNLNHEDTLFCGTPHPIVYLDAEANFGTMGTPFFVLDYNRLEEYYNMHPDKFPTSVYYYEFTSTDLDS